MPISPLSTVALLALAAGAHAAAPSADAQSPAGHRLVWSDEFDADGAPDPSKWRFENGFERNEEAQWYQPENATCRDGLLVIEARRERVANPNHDPSSGDWRRSRPFAEYTSSCLKTAGLFSWQYGVMEVRARIDALPGLWPAIWTIGEKGPWPGCGEVDLMEYYQDSLLANACWHVTKGAAVPEGIKRSGHVLWDSTRRPMAEIGDESWAGEFHLWRMEWNADRIRLLVDDRLLNEIDLTTIQAPPERPHPFRQPHFVLLNLAVGGQQGGDPSATEFPARFEVDYVRVFETDSDG